MEGRFGLRVSKILENFAEESEAVKPYGVNTSTRASPKNGLNLSPRSALGSAPGVWPPRVPLKSAPGSASGSARKTATREIPLGHFLRAFSGAFLGGTFRFCDFSNFKITGCSAWFAFSISSPPRYQTNLVQIETEVLRACFLGQELDWR